MTAQGTITDVNAALNGLAFTPPKDVYGTGVTKLRVSTSDLGNSPSPAKTDNGDEVFFDVTAVDNDPPGNNLPAGAGTYRNVDKVLSLANLNQIEVEDPDFPPSTTPVRVELSSTHGTMTLASTAGLTITSGANGSAAMTLEGVQSDITGAFDAGLTFAVEPDFTGQATIAITSTDLTDLRTDSDVLSIEVDPPGETIYWTAAKETVPFTPAGLVATGSANVTAPRGLALDLQNDRVYWTNNFSTQGVSFAPLPGASGTAGNFTVTGSGFRGTTGVAVDLESGRLFWTNGSADVAGDAATRLRFATLSDPFSSTITGSVFNIAPNAGGGLRSPAIDSAANRIYWANGSDKISYANLDGMGGGADLPTGGAMTNSPEGATILKDPEPVSPPQVSGTAQVGQELTCAAATWAADQPNAALYRMPASTEFSWTLAGSVIAGATSATYTPATAGEYRCKHSATNFAGTTTQQSAAVTVVAAPTPDPGPTPTPDPDLTPTPDPTPSAPATPTLSGLASPARDRTPTLKGSAPANTTVRIFSSRDCGGIPLGTVSAAAFASTGVTVPVPRNAATSLYAQAVDLLGRTSACSSALVYTHDGVAPDTEVRKHPSKSTTSRKAVFKFGTVQEEDDPAFECRLDDGDWKSCESKRRVRVRFGRHTFRVRSADVAGNVDGTPAKFSWRRVRD